MSSHLSPHISQTPSESAQGAKAAGISQPADQPSTSVPSDTAGTSQPAVEGPQTQVPSDRAAVSPVASEGMPTQPDDPTTSTQAAGEGTSQLPL